MKIYIVEGTCGEYDDRQFWTVGAYLSEETAIVRKNLAANRAKEMYNIHGKYFSTGTNNINEYDPEMRTDYTGTDYNVYPISILDFDKFADVKLKDIGMIKEITDI